MEHVTISEIEASRNEAHDTLLDGKQICHEIHLYT